MPNRILKESITTSCEIDSLTPEVERFFYRLIVVCDDFGRMSARPSILRAKCFPLKLDKVKDKDITKWLQSLVDNGLIIIYSASDGKTYLQMATWEKHQQKRAKHSKYPAPANGMISNDISCNQLQSNVTDVRETRNEKREYEAEQFELFWKAYPRQKEKQAAFTKWKACIKEDKPGNIIKAAENYAAECSKKNTETQFIKLAKTFLGPDKHYREYMGSGTQEEGAVPRPYMTRQEQVDKGLLSE